MLNTSDPDLAVALASKEDRALARKLAKLRSPSALRAAKRELEAMKRGLPRLEKALVWSVGGPKEAAQRSTLGLLRVRIKQLQDLIVLKEAPSDA